MQPNILTPTIQQLANNHARSLQEALAQAAISAGVLTPDQASDLVLARSNINVQSIVHAIGTHAKRLRPPATRSLAQARQAFGWSKALNYKTAQDCSTASMPMCKSPPPAASRRA